MIDVSREYLRYVVERLESFASHPLGFRVAGTPEERAATAFIADEMRAAECTIPELRRPRAARSPEQQAACILA